MEATLGASRAERVRALWVPLTGTLLLAGTVAYGLAATADGFNLGTKLPPFLVRWMPEVSIWALAAALALGAGVLIAPRLRAHSLSPADFVAATLVLGLALRLLLGMARGGVGDLYAVYDVPNDEASNEYLPALPAFDFGARGFLDTFAEIGTALPVHAVGHPPGLLLALHWLGIDGAQGMAALTIAAGALCIPLVYVLARELLDEARARMATLLYVFAPSAILYGATSADALFATAATVAAVTLVARRPVLRALGPAALALASFFSYANLAIGAFAAILALRRDGLRRAVMLSAACLAALVAFYALLHLATGYDPLGALSSVESVYREGVAARRPYGYWLFGSPAAFLLAAGLPLAWLALRSLGDRAPVALALFAVVGIAAVLGFTKAETERIYQFLVPLLCVAAACSLPAGRLQPVLAALAVQALAVQLLLYTVW